MFSHVIVKTPCTAMVHGITGHPELGAPDYEKALEQHRAYIETLRQCGVDVTVLPADEAYPDSCFVEDAAVLTKYCAVITNPGAPSRKGETAAIEPARPPATGRRPTSSRRCAPSTRRRTSSTSRRAPSRAAT